MRTQDPILRDRVPVAEIASRQLALEGVGFAGREDKVVEAAEDDGWVVGGAKVDVLCFCFVSDEW